MLVRTCRRSKSDWVGIPELSYPGCQEPFGQFLGVTVRSFKAAPDSRNTSWMLVSSNRDQITEIHNSLKDIHHSPIWVFRITWGVSTNVFKGIIKCRKFFRDLFFQWRKLTWISGAPRRGWRRRPRRAGRPPPAPPSPGRTSRQRPGSSRPSHCQSATIYHS